MKMKSILLSMLAVATFCSCSKDDVDGTSSEEKSVSLSISLGELNMSKSVGLLSANVVAKIGNNITIEGLTDAGAVESTVVLDITNTGLFAVSGNDKNVYTSAGGVIVMPETVTQIRVTGNADNGTLTSGINTRQGAITEAKVRVIGVGEITGDPHTCKVNITPEMARIEVKGAMVASALDTYVRNVTLQAIYMNNTIMTRDAAIGTINRTASTSDAWIADFKADGSKLGLFDNFSILNDDGAGLGFGDGFDKTIGNEKATTHATGYNIFPQAGTATDRVEAAEFSPHMIFEFKLERATAINADNDASAWSGSGTYYLNVVAFKDAGDFVASFEKGNVYQFDLSELYTIINDTYPSPVTTTPDPITVGVELKVTVGKWTVKAVTPEV